MSSNAMTFANDNQFYTAVEKLPPYVGTKVMQTVLESKGSDYKPIEELFDLGEWSQYPLYRGKLIQFSRSLGPLGDTALALGWLEVEKLKAELAEINQKMENANARSARNVALALGAGALLFFWWKRKR